MSTIVRTCILFAALAAAPFASAQWRTSQDAEICVTGTGVRSLDIAVCSRALGREELSELDRASVLTARGRAYRDSDKLPAALADFDTALTLNPYSANAFHERALTVEAGGDHAQALEDFGRALALSPRFAAAYKNRGIAHFYAADFACARADLESAAMLAANDAEIPAFLGFVDYLAGRYTDAAADFRRVRALGLPYPYLPIWIYLNEARSGMPDSSVLLEAGANLVPGEWPRPLLEVYLGVRDSDSLMAILEGVSDPQEGVRRLAEWHFYLAALELLYDRREQAVPHLEMTLAVSDHGVPERVLAEHELTAAEAVPQLRSTGDC